ncbi:unnamed protein product [Pieris brassicae]|uniref:Uncharacterized protein n=1 Tax=Pieris brassicae TaxID=7116 RepID=A0A9P0TRA8_PIEBR|nr:unnamed protein product [Pieris brassicae]
MYSFMTVPQLKDELKSFCSWFEAYDRNANFGAEEVEEDEVYNAPAEYFRDINGNTPLPPITKQLIQAFVERFQAQLKGRQMYEERFLLTARAAAGDFTFIQGQCKAQMKKIFYVVDVGYMELKTWKVYFDSPKQAQKLPCRRTRSVNYLPLKEEDMMENYNDHIKNMAVSYGNTTMPILQTIRPANTYAVENDHQYTQKSLKDELLTDLLLKNPSPEKILDIERSTRQQYQSTEWQSHRLCRITASNFYAVTHSKASTQKHLAQKNIRP